MKKKCGPSWSQNDLLYSNVVEHPLKLACFYNTTIPNKKRENL